MPAIPSATHILGYLGARDAPQDIPVGAMIGGLAGGAVLAILCIAGCLLWAKAMRRSKEKNEREANAQRRTKTNTRYNASALSQPWPEVYQPTLLRAPETRVKFEEKDRTFSGPKPLRSAKVNSERPDAQAGVPRLPSTVSSVSLYSAESAEEHQIRAPTSLILAALGSVEAVLTRGSWGDRRPHYRASQATSGSACSQEVGVAY